MREELRTSIIKKYWQAMNGNGNASLYHTEKPFLCSGVWVNNGNHTDGKVLFPISLKPLQIAEITVCDDGTWSYEIEREEGWYAAKSTNRASEQCGKTIFIEYVNGTWHFPSRNLVAPHEIPYLTISQTRIPDECIR